MFRFHSVLLLLVTYSGNFGRLLLATKFSALDDCASFPVASLMNTDCVRITVYNRRTFPFTFNDPRMLLQPHSETLQDDADSVLKFATNNLEQSIKENLPQRETENYQEPQKNDLLQANINTLIIPTKEELQQPINKIPHQTRRRGLVTPTNEDVHEQLLEDQQQGEVWALLEKTVWACHQLLQYFDAHLTQMNFDAVLGTRIAEGEEKLVEKQSDECLAELLGGTVYHDGGVDEDTSGGDVLCIVSQKCWQRMTAQGYSGYSLTHQVFYLTIGLRAGCGEQLELLAARDGGVNGGARSDVTHILAELCTAVLQEATAISQAGFPDYRRDLFMEQGALCGILGYRNFFKKDWLSRVLSWQKDPGCFGASSVIPDQLSTTPDQLSTTPDQLSTTPDQLSTTPDQLSTTPHHTRMRREERPMGGHCLAHRSAVALGYLSLSVRFLVTVL
nr:uncharacterized protein LOC128685731 [Cherax quadricarinatus]